jgi:hypothetical protein
MATKFLAHSLRHALLSDLASNGYEWKDENGIPRILLAGISKTALTEVEAIALTTL